MDKKTEHQIQTDWFNWLHFLSDLPDYWTRLIYAVPNGGFRNPKEAIRFQAEGVKSGIPDVNVDIPNEVYHGMRIEFKKPGGTLSDTQVDIHALLDAQGYYVVTCYTVEEAINELENYLNENERDG